MGYFIETRTAGAREVSPMTLLSLLDRRSRANRSRRAGTHAPPVARLRVEVLEDRTVPSFLAPASYAVGVDPSAVAAGDFNNDGDLDLAVANFLSGSVSVLRGQGNGSFGPTGTISLNGGTAESVAVGDLNADGKLDLVVGSRQYFGGPPPPGAYEWIVDVTTSAKVLLGNGDGSFQVARDFAANTTFTRLAMGGPPSTSVAVGDFNNDGTLDIGVTSQTGVQLYAYYPPPDLADHMTVLLGDGEGNFSAAAPATLNGVPGSLATGDFNNDGNLDLATAGGALLLGQGDGTARVTFTGVVGDDVAAADLNGDGNLDLAHALSWADNGVRVSPGNGDGTFQAGTTYSIPYAIAVAVGDFNQDGRPDLAARRGGFVTVLLGDGNGNFEARAPSTANGSLSELTVADFDGDGLPDLATANGSADTVSVLINDGNWLPQPPPSLTISDASTKEGNGGQTLLQFTVRLSAAAARTVTVNFATADGTAASGSDYQPVSGPLTFLPGETSKTITVMINGDRVPEPNETLFVNLTEPANATLADTQGRGAIVDDEPRIGINDVKKREGLSGTTLFVFTVSLSAAYDQAVTVDFATADGTATAGSDYQAKSGTLTFAPCQTTATVTVVVIGDQQAEADETFFVNLTGPSGNSLLIDGQGIGTILNDDHGKP
jgi:hypothetical protein